MGVDSHRHNVAADVAGLWRGYGDVVIWFAIVLYFELAFAGVLPYGDFQIIGTQGSALGNGELAVDCAKIVAVQVDGAHQVAAGVAHGDGDGRAGWRQGENGVVILAHDAFEVDNLTWAVDGAVGIQVSHIFWA